MIDDPIFLILLSSWAAGVVLAIWLACRHIGRVYRTHWYDLSKKGPLKELEWCQICEVMEKDPLENQRGCRRPGKWLCLDLPVFAILIALFWASFKLICYPDRYDVVKDVFGLPVGVSALVGAALAVLYKVRLTARAKNRQVWINSVRKHIGTLIDNCPPQGKIDQDNLKKYKINLTKLELLINPSERIHRSFMAIVRFMYGIHNHPLDKGVLWKLCITTPPGKQASKNGQVARKNCEELKAKATRLANVLLKREWEQVKHAR